MSCSPQDVRDITGSTLTDPQIEPFIAVADCLIAAAADCTTATQACQDQACSQLSAHFLSLSPVGSDLKTIKKEDFEDEYSVEYAINSGATGKGILSTSYGSTANMLMGGCLVEQQLIPAGGYSIGGIC